MLCTAFDAHWNDWIAKSLDHEMIETMEAHARNCADCGAKMSAHEDLAKSIESVVQIVELPETLPGAIDDMSTSTRTVAMAPSTAGDNRLNQNGSTSVPMLAFASIVGGLIGYLVGSSFSGSRGGSLMEQMFFEQMINRGRGMNPQMMIGMLGGVSDIVQSLFFLLLVIWVPRSRAWRIIYPSRIPKMITMAQWLSILSGLLGCLHIAISIGQQISTRVSMFGRLTEDDMAVFIVSGSIIAPLWWCSFWLVAFILLIALVNEWVIRHAEQHQDSLNPHHG